MNTLTQPVIPKVTLEELLARAQVRNRRRFSRELLKINCEQQVERICAAMRKQVLCGFRKKGVVIGLSGGIDSSTVAALAVRALGRERVLALLMPEKDSCAETLTFSQMMAEHLGLQPIHEDISPILAAAGCYRRRDEAVRLVVPEYGPGWKLKLVLPSVVDGESFRIFSVVAQSADGTQIIRGLTLEANLQIIAATNFKQRTRKMLEYAHADRLNYAVAGTPNRLEYTLGFFVKLGDGAADLKPIAHLYKTQVYELAAYLGVPTPILNRPPTTDTYSLPQTQEEFYFCLPYQVMDLVLYGKSNGYTPTEVAPQVGLRPEQVQRVFRDIDAKRRVGRYLRAQA